MIFLVAAGREGGGDGTPVFFTVPWCPSIGERGQMPGSIVKKLLELRRALPRDDDRVAFGGMSQLQVFLVAMGHSEYDLRCAVSLTILHGLLRELGLLDPVS